MQFGKYNVHEVVSESDQTLIYQATSENTPQPEEPDWAALLKAALATSKEVQQSELLRVLMLQLPELLNAQKFWFFLAGDKETPLQRVASIENGHLSLSENIPLSELPPNIQQQLKQAIQQKQSMLASKSVHCLVVPMFRQQQQLLGLFYLERSHEPFRPVHQESLEHLAAQISISMENVRLYEQLQSNNNSLRHANQTLQDLSRMKDQLLTDTSEQLKDPVKEVLSMMKSGKDLVQSGLHHPKILEAFQEITTLSYQNTQQLNQTVSQILKLSSSSEISEPDAQQAMQQMSLLPAPNEPDFSMLKAPVLPKRQACVLVVDDEPISRKVAFGHLTYAGYEVLEASSGQEALDLLHTRTSPVDLVLLDVMMPGMNGYETCGRLRKEYSYDQMAILFLSAKSQELDAGQGFEAGGDDYLEKPLQKSFLLARVKLSIERLKVHQMDSVVARIFCRRDVAFIEKSNSENFCEFVHQDGSIQEAYVTLAELEHELPKEFLRVNRSVIVNKTDVKHIQQSGPPSKPDIYFTLMYGKEARQFRVSRGYVKAFQETFL